MPSIKDQSTVEAIAREYCSNGRNKTEALKAIGYSKSYYEGGRSAEVVWGNERIIEAIRDIDASNAEESSYTVAQCQLEYEEARQMGITLNQPSAVVSAITGKARLFGFDKDNQLQTDTPAELTPEQLEQATRASNVVLANNMKVKA